MSEVQTPKSGLPDRPAAKAGVVVPHAPRWRERLAARLIYATVLGLTATVRFRLDDKWGYFSEVPREKLIFSIWHNRLSLGLMLYRNYVARRVRGRELVALVSASRDGGLLARVLELFGVRAVRGSSSRRGPQALREMTSWGERGHDLAITPDGPRGPCYQVQEGVISVAQLTGLPIVPVSFYLNWKIHLKSWDRFQVPLPFARCEITVGRIIRVPRDITDSGREELRIQLEAEMRAITRD
jgi:lysophospholipid acyltransferase (LPLAT)-like uncharacterized protein